MGNTSNGEVSSVPSPVGGYPIRCFLHISIDLVWGSLYVDVLYFINGNGIRHMYAFFDCNLQPNNSLPLFTLYARRHQYEL